jgi:hypothetical protein
VEPEGSVLYAHEPPLVCPEQVNPGNALTYLSIIIVVVVVVIIIIIIIIIICSQIFHVISSLQIMRPI